MATNRPDTLDPALMRPGRLDRKVEFGLPDLEGRSHIFKIHARSMSVERDIRFELLARLCPNSTGNKTNSSLENLLKLTVINISTLRSRNSFSVHRSWHVCHSCSSKGSNRKRFLGSCQQSYQVVR